MVDIGHFDKDGNYVAIKKRSTEDLINLKEYHEWVVLNRRPLTDTEQVEYGTVRKQLDKRNAR